MPQTRSQRSVRGQPSRTPLLPAFRVLRRRLGLFGALRLGLQLKRRERRGEPFGGLGPPVDEQEALSRAQAGPALLLYDELRRMLPDDAALGLTREVVLASGVVFMRRAIGKLEQRKLARLDDRSRRAFLEDKESRFFNATMRWDHIGTDEVAFTVTHCHFPRLCQAVGMPEVAPLFCDVDAAFFGAVEPNVVLEREGTIARGRETCPFKLRWAK